MDREALKAKVVSMIAPHVSEAVATSWNAAIDRCVELASTAEHHMLAAEMKMLKTSTDEVNGEVLKHFSVKG